MENKNIFKYFDGFEDVYADPSEIDYRFSKASENEDMDNLDKWLMVSEDDPDIEKKMPLFSEACHRLDPIVRHAFEIKPFDRKTGEGMLHEDVMNVYLSYMEWKHNVKKNTEELPTSVSPSVSPKGSFRTTSPTNASMASVST